MEFSDYDASRDERPRPLISPKNMMPIQVVRREVLARDVVALQIALPNTTQPPAPYLPGQFVTLALPTAKETLYRSYSLCGDGLPHRPWEITIKRLKEGAVSTYLFDVVKEGTLLYSSLPRGTFTLPTVLNAATPIIFIAIGSGITPIIGMLRSLALLPDDERPYVQLHYASRTREDIIYRTELARMDLDETWLQQWHYLSSEGQRMAAAAVVRNVAKLGRRAHWYMCGPESLKREMHGMITARGVPEDHIHSEVFATQRGASTVNFRMVKDEDDGTIAAYMRVEATDAVLGVQNNETILTALERHGYHPDSSCRTGSCGVCKLKLLSGRVEPTGGSTLTPGERAAGFMLSCIGMPQGDITIANGGRPPKPGEVAAAAHPLGGSRLLVTAALRVATVVMASGLLLGAWQLTNHRPQLIDAQGPIATFTALPTATPKNNNHPTPTPTVHGSPTPTLQPGVQPTATQLGVQPTATQPRTQPTATPHPPVPTPTVCTTPSGKIC